MDTFDFDSTELFNLSLAGMIIFSPEGIVLRANKAASDLLGDSRKIAGCKFAELFHSDPPIDIFAWHKSAVNGTPTSDQFNVGLVKIKGEPAVSSVKLNLLQDAKLGMYILCQLRTIPLSNDKNAEAIYQNHLLTELINHIPDNIFVKDKESRFILANDAIAKLMGVDVPKDLIGKTDFDFHPKKLAAKYRRDEAVIISTGEAEMNIVEQVLDKRRSLRWYSTTKIPLKNTEGEIIGIMGVGRDITQFVKKQKALRKAKHDAEKADKLKTAFLANLSHEIRTPLNAILGFSQFLRKLTEPDSKGHKYIDFIVQNGKLLLHLISDIIDISKIDAGQLFINRKNFMLNELMRQLELTMTEVLKEKGKDTITLHMELALDDDDSIIHSDDLRIKQVLHNLLMNAIKFTDKGSIVFGYRFEGNSVKFYVRDTGIGIAPENLNIIFDRFTQVDHSIGRQYEGTGVGLSIVKGLVDLLGGQIEVKSEMSKGTEFSFTLPLDGKSFKISQRNKLPGKTQNQPLIFILGNIRAKTLAADIKSVRREATVKEFTHLDELHIYLKSTPGIPDLILCCSGNKNTEIVNLIDSIKDMMPEVPILAVVNNTRNLLLEECLAAGAKDYIAEPVNASLLVEKIKLLITK
jgi:PAS domain S-box-containing protein